MKIVVASNCQSGGIAVALQQLLPHHEVAPAKIKPLHLNARGELPEALAEADAVFGLPAVGEALSRAGSRARFIPVIGLHFSAFHPDLVGAKHDGQFFGNNSAIALWAYNKRLGAEEAARLYNKKVFAALGYLNRWDSSAAVLKENFEEAGLGFDRFWLALKREGRFMHTANHPNGVALAWFAKVLAAAVVDSESVWRKEVAVVDVLARFGRWPVYPEIANELGVPGSYTWFVESGAMQIDGLPEFIEYSYKRYADAGVEPGKLAMTGANESAYGAVLTSALEQM